MRVPGAESNAGHRELRATCASLSVVRRQAMLRDVGEQRRYLVLIGQHGLGHRPVDADSRVHPADAALGIGVEMMVASVLRYFASAA